MSLSEQLQQTQSTLEKLACEEINSPMTDYANLSRLLKVIKEVDSKRRKAWNEERFGGYDDLASNVVGLDFNSDDISF